MAWVKLDDQAPRNRKLLRAGPAAAWLWVCGIAHAQSQLTDGFIADEALPLIGVIKGAKALAKRLVLVGLFDRVEGGYQVHDYHHHNLPSGVVKDRRQKISHQRADAGRLGALARWQTDGKPMANGNGTAMAPSHPIPSHPKNKSSGAAAPRDSRPVEKPSDNIAVMTRLAHDVIEADPLGGYPDLLEAAKVRCAALHIAYDSRAVGQALESALHQRARRTVTA